MSYCLLLPVPDHATPTREWGFLQVGLGDAVARCKGFEITTFFFPTFQPFLSLTAGKAFSVDTCSIFLNLPWLWATQRQDAELDGRLV